jgi:hypothetical protein
MIAAVTYTQRFLVIVAVITAAAAVGLYFLGRHIRYALQDRPYIAAVKTELRALAVAQDSFRVEQSTYATDVAAIRPPRIRTSGVRLQILRADSSGFIAEGLHDVWTGRCVVALGRYVADSLIRGEPKCHG